MSGPPLGMNGYASQLTESGFNPLNMPGTLLLNALSNPSPFLTFPALVPAPPFTLLEPLGPLLLLMLHLLPQSVLADQSAPIYKVLILMNSLLESF